MKSLIVATVGAIVGLLAGPSSGGAQDTIDWRRDLDYLASVLPQVHGHAFHTISRASFDSASAALRARMPSLPDPVARVELAALVASIGDGHTRVNLLSPGGPGVPAESAGGFVPLPIRPYQFADGLFVRSAREGAVDLLGARIVAVGRVPVTEVFDRLRRYAHRDNEMTVRLLVPVLMTRPAFLLAAGVIDSTTVVPMEFVARDGRRVERMLRPTADGVPDAGPWIDAADAAGAEPPLWRQRNDEHYWFEPIEGGQTVYLQFNVVRDAAEESMADFANRLARALDERIVERLIIDLRNNDGGNWVLAVPLIDAIAAAPVNRPGSLFLLTGRATFSAAGSVAALLEDRTEAVVVGEPTGARPNAWGDMDTFTLPESGLSVSYSERFFQSGGPYDDRPWVAPAIAAEASYTDYEAGRDPVLEAIAVYEPGPSLRTRLGTALRESGVEAALAAYDEFTSRPERRWYWAHDDLSALGIHLWLTNRVAASIPVWERMAEDYPGSAEGRENLAETYADLGERDAALEALEASLRIDPANGDALEVLQELCGHDAVAALVPRLTDAGPPAGALRASCSGSRSAR